MNWISKFGDKKVLTILFVLAILCYFVSESILRQYVLFRTGEQSISLNSILDKLPGEIRDGVERRITIAELKDKLAQATDQGEKIFLLISLAQARGPEALQKQYAEIIDKYPDAPQSEAAFVFYLKAPPKALKSISIPRFHQYLKKLREPDLFYAWSGGLSKLKSVNASEKELLEYLLPLLDSEPKYREYRQLYTEIVELAFNLKDQPAELKARKYEELCEKKPFYDSKLARKYKKKKTTKKKKKK